MDSLINKQKATKKTSPGLGPAANGTNNVNGDSFKVEGRDLKSSATSGTYTINADFFSMTFKVQ
jgi:hypothetical protein